MSRNFSESSRFRLYNEPTKTSVKISFIVDVENNLLTYSLMAYLNTDLYQLGKLTFTPKDKYLKNQRCSWPSSTVKIYPNTICEFFKDLKEEIIAQFMMSTNYIDFVLELRNMDKTLFSSCSIDKIHTEKVSDYMELYFADLESRILDEGLGAVKPVFCTPFRTS